MGVEISVMTSNWQDASVRLEVRCNACGEDWYEIYRLSEVDYQGRPVSPSGAYRQSSSRE